MCVSLSFSLIVSIRAQNRSSARGALTHRPAVAVPRGSSDLPLAAFRFQGKNVQNFRSQSITYQCKICCIVLIYEMKAF